MKRIAQYAAYVLLGLSLAGCAATARFLGVAQPKASEGILEQIEAAELTAQQLQQSITNLTCTKFVAQKCAEVGKVFDPTTGAAYHEEVAKARAGYKVAKGIPIGQTALCLGAQRTAISCLAVAKAIVAEIERKQMQAQGAN